MIDKTEILSLLPQNEAEALTSRQVFELYKGGDDVKDVSDALGYYWRNGTICRTQNNAGKLVYWRLTDAEAEKIAQTNNYVLNATKKTAKQPEGEEKPSAEQARVISPEEKELDIAKRLLAYQEPPREVEASLKPTFREFVAASLERGFQTEPEPATPIKPMMPEISTESLQTPKPESYTAADEKLLEELFKQNPLDVQIGGDHYKKLGQYQPWEVLKRWLTPEELKGAMKKEVITYLAREQDKGGRQDIEKALHTIQIYMQLTEGEVAA